jgi:phosphatidylglycerol---prolipoprotein diacylglyceryl transferase
MLPILFRIHLFGHEFPVYGYGLMLVIAYFACVKAGQWLGKRCGIHPDLFLNATVIAMITGIAGARLCSVLENLPDYTRHDLTIWQNLAHIFNTREGGLTFYGGFLLATPACIYYAIRNKVPVLLGMDIVAPLVMIGLGFGRIGCFLNGCCYGEQSNLPWAVRFPYDSYAYQDQFASMQISPPAELTTWGPSGVTLLPARSESLRADPNLQSLASSQRALPVQPTELYSAFTAFLLAGLLIAYFTLPHIDGRVFALMLILEGIARFILELIRVEPPVWVLHLHGQSYGMSLSMILGLSIAVAGVILWFDLPLHRQPAVQSATT